ncbi:MAG: energy transducer TonB [Acidobacteriota bacterium]|jgi:TonB family protein|nr:energy transducer TonB [Acidobacteriota bacterium]
MSRKNVSVAMSGLLALALLAARPARAAGDAFAYASQNYVITAEPAGAHAFVVNVINFSDYVIVVQPQEFIYRGASGRFYVGQVFELEHKDPRGEMQRYTASSLVKGRSFAGLKVVGAFHEQDAVQELSVRIGARRFFLQGMGENAFEQLARKVQNIDLDALDPAAAFASANLQDVGSVEVTDGSPEWERDWEGLLTADGVNPPKILERPAIEPTPAARKARTYGKVRLTGIITKNGALRDLRVSKGLGKGLDERAMEGVRNSWVFLPATKNGEVHEAQIPIEVEFPDPDKD